MFAIVGVAVTALGLTLVIAANWEEIPRPVKLGGSVSLMLAAYVGGYWTREVLGRRYIGESILLLGPAFFFGSAILVAQQYHIDVHVAWAFLLLFAALLPLPYLFRIATPRLRPGPRVPDLAPGRGEPAWLAGGDRRKHVCAAGRSQPGVHADRNRGGSSTDEVCEAQPALRTRRHRRPAHRPLLPRLLPPRHSGRAGRLRVSSRGSWWYHRWLPLR